MIFYRLFKIMLENAERNERKYEIEFSEDEGILY